MAKFKKGDKVRIRRDLESKFYGDTYCGKEMLKYKGEIATIIAAYSGSYLINLDGERFHWVDDMFEDTKIEPVKDKKYVTLKTKTFEKYSKKIDALEEELNEKNSKIDFLNGQIYAYEKVIGTMEEDF